jgi:hypothetical protein
MVRKSSILTGKIQKFGQKLYTFEELTLGIAADYCHLIGQIDATAFAGMLISGCNTLEDVRS